MLKCEYCSDSHFKVENPKKNKNRKITDYFTKFTELKYKRTASLAKFKIRSPACAETDRAFCLEAPGSAQPLLQQKYWRPCNGKRILLSFYMIPGLYDFELFCPTFCISSTFSMFSAYSTGMSHIKGELWPKSTILCETKISF